MTTGKTIGLTRWIFVSKIMSLLFNMLSRLVMGFPCGLAGKESTCNTGDLGLIPGLGRSLGEGKGYPLHYSGLENSMDWIVHGVKKSQTRLSDFHFQVGHSFSSEEQVSFNFMAAITICSDFGAQENKVCHCFHCFPIYLPWSDGTGCHELSILSWVLSQLFPFTLPLSSRGSLVPTMPSWLPKQPTSFFFFFLIEV